MSGAGELLRALGAHAPAGVPSDGNRAGAPRADGVEGAFGAMLERARAGELSSGREVRVARSAGVELTEDQLTRIAAAADRAETAGSKHALVLIDGRALKLDVASREITARVELGNGAVLTGIDAVVQAAASENAGPDAAVTPALLGGLNPALLNVMTERERGGADAAA